MSNVEFLRQLELFKGLPQADLERLCAMSREVTLAPGELGEIVLRSPTMIATSAATTGADRSTD